MRVSDAIAMGTSIVVGLGGGGGIVLGLSGYLGKLWADLFLERERHKYGQQILELQSQIDHASRILQVRLNTLGLTHELRTKKEFARLGELWKKMEMLSAAFNYMAGSGIRLYPADPEERKVYEEKLRNSFLDYMLEARRYFHEEELFIPEAIAEMAKEAIYAANHEPFLYASFYQHYDSEIRLLYKKAVGEDLEKFNDSLEKLKKLMREHINAEKLSASVEEQPPHGA